MQIFRKNQNFSVAKRWFIALLCLTLILACCFISVKPFVFTYAKSEAETIILNATNEAVLNILDENDISYSDISNVSRDADGIITGIEIDIEKINRLKSQISNELSKIVSDNNKYDLYIPMGTLFGSEYTTGYGPKIRFKMQLTETAILDFESKFTSAGINNVLHQIIIKIDIKASVLMMGATEGFGVSTTALAAQTVIAGTVPDSFTNVIEYPENDLADEVFNFGDLG
ncbi:MAG: sporulation protein YunB [Clostridia bacterium]|nr:sporulation protein YunB [Clostridia bacterium]